jgi:hypothetical protein
LRIDTLGDELVSGLVWHGLVACVDVSMRAKLSPFFAFVNNPGYALHESKITLSGA